MSTTHRGRKSASELAVVPIDVGRIRIEPPKNLEAKAAAIFKDVVDSVEPRHFRRADIPLLASFARATHLAAHYSSRIGGAEIFRQWVECTKLQMQLATKLRLTPSSRTDSRAANRTTDTPDEGKPWEEKLLGGWK
jgi:phage terminase small subunit